MERDETGDDHQEDGEYQGVTDDDFESKQQTLHLERGVEVVRGHLCRFVEFAFTDAQLLGYEKFWDIISMEKTLYRSAERRGLAKEMEKGRAEGKAEERRLIVINLKKLNVLTELISQSTGLTPQEINQL